MQDKITYKQKDLVLHPDYNPLLLDVDLWDDYLDYLCKDRYYQKEAIKASLKFLIGGVYNNLYDLAKKNYQYNKEIKEVFLKEHEYLEKLSPMKDKLFANIDLVTGSGKSYVMFAIAHIMLCLGIVDKVLVLCPSLTIESGLMEKFTLLISDNNLMNLIPKSLSRIIPNITDANSTILDKSICIENIHSVYQKTGSSIKDSFLNNGERTLVLNDESHHIFNKTPDNDNKKWIEFLLNKDYNFKYLLGFTGTAYQGDYYFMDVIYRYSIRQAIDDGFIKNIEYVEKDCENFTENERFQIIQEEHNSIKAKYKNTLKPLTILITKDIAFAESLKQKLINFFYSEYNSENKIEKEEEIKKEIAKKILKITYKSTNEEKLELKKVDDIDSKIEYIIGVSMLNEGWDVKNVFQIVPMEEKAFNSKLLISQVLGRGLRTPLNIINPKLVVFNHYAWGKNIKELVDSILELETKIIISPSTNQNLHFKLHKITPDREEVEVEKTEKETKIFDYSKSLNEGINLLSQEINKSRKIEYFDIKYSNEIIKNYETKSIVWTVDEIVTKISNELSYKEWEGVILKINDQHYSKKNLPSNEIIKSIILKSMEKRNITDDVLTEQNANLIFSSFSTILRKSNNKIDYNVLYDEPEELNTINVNLENIGISNFRKNDFCFFYSDDYLDNAYNDSQKIILEEFIEGGFPYAKKMINKFLFKSATNFVFSSSIPEKKFIDLLVDKNNAPHIEMWLKSKNKGFYSINYSIKKGTPQSRNREYKIQGFNPDFFIKIKDMDLILVVETKADKDDSLENKAKYKYAKNYFEELNKKLEEYGDKTRYIFNILSPEAYSNYFFHLKKAINNEYDLRKYKCELELLLEE